MGHDYRLHTFWALADRPGVDLEIESLRTLADDLRQPAQRWHIVATQTVRELMEGGFGRAEELIAEALAVGGRAESWNALLSQRLALFVLRREQGRLEEIEGTIRRSTHEYPALPRFRAALAHLYAELGREAEARAVLDELLGHDLAKEHLDAEWLFTVSLLPHVCAFLGDERAAKRVYALLLPYAALYAEAPLEATIGSVARGLGALATTLRRFDDAEGHFEAALETELRMGGRPWHAHAQHDLATMLLTRAGAGDGDRARELLAAAAAAYLELGMQSWAGRAKALAAYEA
jgi:eukaryotic-like serine/threonine-protein kinase